MVLEWLKGATGVFSAGDRRACATPSGASIGEARRGKAREPRQVCDRLSPTQVRRVVHRRHRLHPSLRLSAVERSVENGPEVAPVRIRDRPWASVLASSRVCIPLRFYGDNDRQIFRRVTAGRFSFPREACNFRSLLDSDPAETYPGPLCRFGGWNVFPRTLSPFALSNLIASKQHLFKSNRGVGGRRRRTIGNRKSLLGAVRVRCDVAHQTALERRPPRHPSSPLHAATAASAKDASRDRRLAQPPRTCPDSDAYSSRASATGLN